MTEFGPGHPSSDNPSVHILGTGGTIANVTGEYDSEENFLPLDVLLDEAPEEVTSGVSLAFTGITHEASTSLTPSVWYRLLRETDTLLDRDDPPDGFVVTHGSNTSEETAYFLNLVLDTERPVVVTAAQRNVKALASDGFKNLSDAVRVAASPEARGRGVLMVVNEEIHHARDVTKSVSGRTDAWLSPNTGRIGDTTPGVVFHQTPDRPSTSDTEFDLSGTSVDDFPLTDVRIVYSSLAADGSLVRATMTDTAGYVVAGFPSIATASPTGLAQQKSALNEAVDAGIPVVVCNRGFEGYKPANGDFISGGTLRPQKARILLALGLMESSERGHLQRLFETY